MNKNNLKLIMELIFIFILPLLFICFTSEIQLEREFTYDNNGNYETSQDTKQLSFDNSIIKYTKIVPEYYEKTNDYTLLENETTYYFKEEDLYYNSINNYYYLWNYEGKYAVYARTDIPDNHAEMYYYNEETEFLYSYPVYLDANNYYYTTTNNNIYNNIFTENYEFKGYFYIKHNAEIKNTIWGNIKQLLIDNLDLNDNILLDVVLCYTILWFIMFLIWHLLYGFLELLFHVIPSRWKEGNLR